MKLASLNEGRDGALVVVSADLTKAVRADRVARTLQSALDNWAAVEPELQRLSEQLESGEIPGAIDVQRSRAFWRHLCRGRSIGRTVAST